MLCIAVQYLLQIFSLNVLLYQSSVKTSVKIQLLTTLLMLMHFITVSCTAICPIKTKLVGSHFKEGIMKAALNNKLLFTQQKF